MLSFADLKSYKFYYWFGFPALISPPITVTSTSLLRESTLGTTDGKLILEALRGHIASQDSSEIIVLGLKLSKVNNIEFISLKDAFVDPDDVILAVFDAATPESSTTWSWHLRNLVALLNRHGSSASARVTVIRLSSKILSKNIHDDDSLVMSLMIERQEMSLTLPRVVGWELNERFVSYDASDLIIMSVYTRGKPGPRLADLSSLLDSRRLMTQAVDLNLRLMRWRLWPELDTQKLAASKCLLLGAGTLGCAVARALLGWGVRDITLVDNGRVSYSNPARQSLFKYRDAVNQVFKAEAAAKELTEIFPDVNARGIVATIPMPGHVLDEEHALLVDELVQSHDIIFALTDSREARWLPTVLAAAYDKILINAALGFDTFLVMRHGHGWKDSSSDQDRLGCYFCSDIVAATNSQRDRTLDQQCTVTRPGLSYLASALAAEMMVALLHSPHGSRHPIIDDGFGGCIPHQIRGSLMDFSQIKLHTPAFNCCTACSAAVVNKYRHEKLAFLRQVSENPKILEDISGVTKLTTLENVDMYLEEEEDTDDF